MFFFTGWPKVVPLKNSEVVNVEQNSSKGWAVILTKDRISIWTFSLNESILLGLLQRSDIDKYGENHFVLWCHDSRKIAVITTKLCVYLYNIEETNEYVLTHSPSVFTQSNINDIPENVGASAMMPKNKKIRIIPYKLLHLMKLPPYSTITRACHLTNDVFVISTNYAQFIHIHWKGHVDLTCQLNLRNKQNNASVAEYEDNLAVTPSTPHDVNPNAVRRREHSLPLARNNKNDSIGIVDLAMSSKLGIMAVVFESGSCWIIPLQKLSRKVATHHLSVNQTTYVNDFENVSCCDVNDRFHFLALGLSTGSVVMYHLHLDVIESGDGDDDTKLQFGLQMVALFDPHQHNLVPQSLALDDVRQVSWSDSGTSLAVCWKKGVAVYSVRGIVVFSTLHRAHRVDDDEDDGSPPHDNDNRFGDLMDDPVTSYYPSCLTWLQKDSGLLMVTHKQQVTSGDFNHYLRQYRQGVKHMKGVEEPKAKARRYECNQHAFVMTINCVKHGLGNLSQSDVSKLALLGRDHICIWRPVHIIDDPESTDYWSRVEMDSHYLSRNWPLRELCVNERSDCFAVAGSTGFALYYRKTARWRLVRSLDGAKVVFICVMAWLTNDLLLVATFDPSLTATSPTTQSKWNLLCVDRWEVDRHFNGSGGVPASADFTAMMEYPLTNHPIGMEALDSNKLLLYFVDGVIHIYDVVKPSTSTARTDSPLISLRNYCVLAPFQTLSPHPVSLRIWNYSDRKHRSVGASNSVEAGFCILSLSATRSLYRIDPSTNERQLIVNGVHDFYLLRETRDRHDRCYLWTYGQHHVRRWDVSIDGPVQVQSLLVSPVQPHMTCLGICNTLNVLVYGRRIIRRMEPLFTPRFSVNVDIRSYLHVTVREKLNRVGLDATFDFVLKAIAGGAWRCLNALEHILRSSLQKRHQIKQREKKAQKLRELTVSNSVPEEVPHEAPLETSPGLDRQDLPQQSLRSSFVFYPDDVDRDSSAPKHDGSRREHEEKESARDSGDDSETVDRTDAGTSTLVMMRALSVEQLSHESVTADRANALQQTEDEEREIALVIAFLRRFPDFPGIVVNVARKTEPSQWKDLFKLCGSPIVLVEKSIARNQLSTASKYLYVFEKVYIEYAIHFATLLIELSVQSGLDNLVLSLLRFAHKLKLMMKESHENNIEIPQLNIDLID